MLASNAAALHVRQSFLSEPAGAGSPLFLTVSPLPLAAACYPWHAAPYVPLNPVVLPQPPRPDIFPGLSGALNISADTWNSYVLQVSEVGGHSLGTTASTTLSSGAECWLRDSQR